MGGIAKYATALQEVLETLVEVTVGEVSRAEGEAVSADGISNKRAQAYLIQQFCIHARQHNSEFGVLSSGSTLQAQLHFCRRASSATELYNTLACGPLPHRKQCWHTPRRGWGWSACFLPLGTRRSSSGSNRQCCWPSLHQMAAFFEQARLL